MLNENHFYKNDWICSGSTIGMAVIRIQTFIQPLVVHDFFYLAQKMILGYQSFQIHNDCFASCVFSSLFHNYTPISSIIQKMGALGKFFDKLTKNEPHGSFFLLSRMPMSTAPKNPCPVRNPSILSPQLSGPLELRKVL